MPLHQLGCSNSSALGVPVRQRLTLQGEPPDDEIDRYLDTIRQFIRMTAGELTLPGVTADPRDDHVVACAVEGHAQYLVNTDDHLLSLVTYAGNSQSPD